MNKFLLTEKGKKSSFVPSWGVASEINFQSVDGLVKNGGISNTITDYKASFQVDTQIGLLLNADGFTAIFSSNTGFEHIYGQGATMQEAIENLIAIHFEYTGRTFEKISFVKDADMKDSHFIFIK